MNLRFQYTADNFLAAEIHSLQTRYAIPCVDNLTAEMFSVKCLLSYWRVRPQVESSNLLTLM
jgi:hypothetical protein